MNTFLVDPVVCLARRESPEDGAPLCGAWLSEHCPGCGLCPGMHADDCDCPERTDVTTSPAARTPRLILRGDTAPTYGPRTRTEAAIETAIQRGYGGTVTNQEMAGSAPSSPVEGTTTTEAGQ